MVQGGMVRRVLAMSSAGRHIMERPLLSSTRARRTVFLAVVLAISLGSDPISAADARVLTAPSASNPDTAAAEAAPRTAGLPAGATGTSDQASPEAAPPREPTTQNDPIDPTSEPPEEPVLKPNPYEEPAPVPLTSGEVALDGAPLYSQPRPTKTLPGDMAGPTDFSMRAPLGGKGTCATSGPRITTGDGFQLALSTSGAVTGIKDGSTCIDRIAKNGGFSMRMIGQSAGNPNIMSNASFESSSTAATSWTRVGTGPTLDNSVGYNSARSIRIARTSVGDSGYLYQTRTVKPNTNYVLGGYFKAGISGNGATYVVPTAIASTNPVVSRNISPLVLSGSVRDSSGRVLRSPVAYGYTNLADWNYQATGFRTPSTAKTVTIRIQMVDGKGTGWFDGIGLRELLAPAGTSLTNSTVVQQDANTLFQTADFVGQPLSLEATYNANPKALRIDGKIRLDAGSTADKAFQLAFVLPVDAVGWYWADFVRASRQIAANTRYDYENYQTNPTSRYPFATVYGPNAISIGSPLHVPRGYTMRYDSREGLVIKFDLALSSATTKLNAALGGGRGVTTFSIQLYRSDPSWGFRGATQKFYDINPGDFTKFPDPEGKLEGHLFFNPDLNALDPNGLADGDQSKDFGLGVNIVGLGYNGNWGATNLRWGDLRDYPTAAYIHMWGDFRQKCAGGGSDCAVLTYAQMVDALQDDATNHPNPRVRAESYSALRSAIRDYNQRIRYDGRYTEYRIFMGPDPDEPGTTNWVDVINTYMRDAAMDAAADAEGTLDAIYSDSTSGFRQWGLVSDYDRGHWSIADSPLMFDYNTGLVAQRGHFNNYEQLKRLRDWANARDMFVSFNFNADEVTEGGYLGGDMSDHFLIEKGLPDRTFPEWGTTVDSFAMLKRTIAGQRPLSSTDQLGCKVGHPITDIRFRVQQSLFYGIYYGPCRWEETSWWSSGHRALFKLYAPYFKRLGKAGWEPITNARSSTGYLRMERFGRFRDDDLNFTLRNESTSTRAGNLVIKLKNVYDNGPVPAQVTANLRYQIQLSNGTYSMRSVTFSSCNGTLSLNAAKTEASLSLTTGNLGALPKLTTGVLRVARVASCP